VFGVFFKPIAEEFAWNREAVSIAVLIRWVIVAVLVVPAGALCDRCGPRKVLVPSFLLLAVSYMLTSTVTQLWHFYLFQGLLLGVGTAGIGNSIMSSIATWHNKRRGLALGITSAGAGASAIFLPPLAVSIITGRGWEQATIAMGVMILAIAVPASLFFKGPPAAGDAREVRPGNGTLDKATGGSDHSLEALRTIPRLLRNGQFLSLFVFFLVVNLGNSFVINHLVNLATDAGMKPVLAATMMSVTGVAVVAGRLVFGYLADRVGSKTDAVVSCSLIIIALVLFALKAEPLTWIAAALIGLGSGVGLMLISVMALEYFGEESLATTSGSILVGGFLGAAVGPWLGGFLFDLTASYLWALVLMALFIAAGTAKVLTMGPPARARDSIFKRY